MTGKLLDAEVPHAVPRVVAAFQTFIGSAERLRAEKRGVANLKVGVIEQFREFAARAIKLSRPDGDSSLARKFLSFIEQSRPLSYHLDRPSPAIAFREFIDKARPQIVDRVKDLLPKIKARAALAARWLMRDDLLAVAGFGFVEDAYTELMAWALRPSTHPESAWLRQQAWLTELGLIDQVVGEKASEPRSQEAFDDGVPDLVMQFEGIEVVVEAKTGTAEHPTPSGKMQTISYERSDITKVVFITPDRRHAANSRAKLATFGGFALCLAEVLEQCPPPEETRTAYKMLITHFLTCATMIQERARGIISAVNQWAAQPDWLDDDNVLRRSPVLLGAIKLFELEENS